MRFFRDLRRLQPRLMLAWLFVLLGLGCGERLQALQTKAESGDAEAQYQLGMCYATGRGVTQNLAEARAWYLKAAEQGNAEAELSLGLVYARGEGVPKDFSEARKWFLKSANHGNAKAKYYLGEH